MWNRNRAAAPQQLRACAPLRRAATSPEISSFPACKKIGKTLSLVIFVGIFVVFPLKSETTDNIFTVVWFFLT
jgi:hypothetical protein